MSLENWMYVDHYYCRLCNLEFALDVQFSSHLLSNMHQFKEEDSLRSHREISFYICRPCGYLSLDTPMGNEMHRKLPLHQYKLQTKNHECPQPIRILHILKDLNRSLNYALEKAHEAEAFFHSHKEQLLEDLLKSLGNHFVSTKLHPTGSTENRIAFPDACVDIILETGVAHKECREFWF